MNLKTACTRFFLRVIFNVQVTCTTRLVSKTPAAKLEFFVFLKSVKYHEIFDHHHYYSDQICYLLSAGLHKLALS